MTGGNKVIWTDRARSELREVTDYLTEEWSVKEVENLFKTIDHYLLLIQSNPKLFPYSKKADFHKAVISKHNTLYYRQVGKKIVILSFWVNYQDPNNRSL